MLVFFRTRLGKSLVSENFLQRKSQTLMFELILLQNVVYWTS